MKEPDLRVINLGAGVQSTAMYLMACRGELTPKPDVAIFADTMGEPPWVYEHLDWLEGEGDIPIRRVSQGNIETDLLYGNPNRKRFAAIPAFLKQATGLRGMNRRQCTYEYKIRPIMRQVREELGLKRKQRAKGKYLVESWFGISVDEAQRMRTPADEWIRNRYPLIFDVSMTRGDCLNWLKREGYPEPKKSACFFCPFHSNKEWLDIKQNAPDHWERAVKIDHACRNGAMWSKNMRGITYLHASLKPLDEVELDPHKDQLDLFGNECEGMCGV